MARYIYYCHRCDTTFDLKVDSAQTEAPANAACPLCGCHDAKLAYAAQESTPPGGHRPPGSGCCGTPCTS